MKTVSTTVAREKCRARRSHSKSSSTAPDIAVSYHGSVLLFHLLTNAARDWMRTHCPADVDHTYFGRALVVEPRYAQNLGALALAEGLTTVQR